MKNEHYRHVLILFIFILCSSCSNKKQLDLGSFEISVPKNWEFKPVKAIDTYAGELVGPGIDVTFDLSNQGFANSLIETEKDFLIISRDLLTRFPDEPIDTNAERGDAITDLILTGKIKRVIHKDTSVAILKVNNSQLKQYPKADYIATLKISGKIRYVAITVPQLIKSHYIVVDTNDNYFRKTIWPKVPGKGMTGVYIHSRKNDFNFQMNAKNLSLENQQQALAAFKTIKFK